jgi:hypothetical protein
MIGFRKEYVIKKITHMNLDEGLLPEKELVTYTDTELFTKIWTSPRVILRYINENNYDKYVYVLLGLAGIVKTFDRASSKSMGDNMPLLGVVATCIIAGGLFGWLTYYLYAALISWTGKWIDGRANTRSILRMIAYAMIPSIASLLFVFAQIVTFGNGIFQSDVDIYESGQLFGALFYFSVLVQVALAIWTLVLMVIGISEVQKLSIGKSILNLLLPVLIIVIPILVIAFIFGDLLG